MKVDNNDERILSTNENISIEKLFGNEETENIITGYDDIRLKSSLKEKKNSTDALLECIAETFPAEEKRNGMLKLIFSGFILLILASLTTVICVIMFLQGFGKIKLEEWTLKLFITSVFLEIIALIKIMINSLFPKDDRKVYLDFIKGFASSGDKSSDVNAKEIDQRGNI